MEVKDVARILGVTTKVIYIHIKNGTIRASRKKHVITSNKNILDIEDAVVERLLEDKRWKEKVLGRPVKIFRRA
jgi:predicted site-specific integrase-resolvase